MLPVVKVIGMSHNHHTVYMNLADRFNLKLKGLLLVSVPLGFQIAFMLVLGHLLTDIDREFNRQYESQTILARLRQTENTITRGLLVLVSANLEEQDAPEEEIRTLKGELQSAILYLEELKSIRPNLINDISTNQKTATDALALLETVKTVFGKGSQIPNTKRFKVVRTDSYALFGHSQKELRKLIDSEMQVRIASPLLVAQMENLLAAVVLAGICIDALLAYWLVKVFSDDIVLRLSKASDNARSIAIEKPFKFKVSGTDEVAKLNKQLEMAAANLDERRQRERAILQSAEDSIFAIDRNYRVASASGNVDAMFRQKAGDILGKPVVDMLSEGRRESVKGFLEDVFKTGKVTSLEIQNFGSNNAITDLRLTARRSVDEKLIVLIVQDISKRKQIERAKQQFVSMISHDVRTPLASVTSALSLIVTGVKGAVPDQAKKAIAEAERQSMRLTERIQNILDVERLESGVVDLNREHASLFDAVDEAVSLVDVLINEKSVKIKREFRDFSLKADRYWLAQSVKHLLISLVETAENNSTIELKTQDAGEEIRIIISSDSKSGEQNEGKSTEQGDSQSVELSESIARTILTRLGGTLKGTASGKSFELTIHKFDVEEDDA